MSDDYLWDKSGDDPEVERLEQLLGGYAHDAPMREPPPRRRRRATVLVVSATVLAAAAVLAILWWRGRAPAASPPRQLAAAGFPYELSADDGLCGGPGALVCEGGTLGVGEWLETAAGARADVKVADIGDLTLRPGSRLRLVATGPAEHRLELERGRLSARVTAPPRLFVIDTPVVSTVDLGCAYDMEVDAAGRTHVRVTSGSVSLEGNGHAAWVPWGHEATADRARGPSTPVRSDAPAAFRDAVARFDAGGGGGAWSVSPLATIVDEATPADAVTLWNLLSRTEGADRAAVFARLDEVAIRPEWVIEEDVLSLQPDALERWRESLEGTWFLDP